MNESENFKLLSPSCEMEYYERYFKQWAFLRYISVETALNMIKQQPESKIIEFIDLTLAEIEVMINKYKIRLDDPLACDFKDGTRIEEREYDFFYLIKKGYSAKDIASRLMVSSVVVGTNIKKFLAKILLHLYPNLKNNVQQNQF